MKADSFLYQFLIDHPHENIIPFVDFFEGDKTYSLVMNYFTLEALLY